ncbi:hypothetical protein LTR50_006220 [Elasticomyces elasticus]|nr:hypothetical protein LTR50_006220 [Elasticomyces elasticus]
MRVTSLYVALVALVGVALIYYATFRFGTVASEHVATSYPRPSPLPDTPSSESGPSHGWIFDYRKDGRQYGLSDAQCDSAFPRLYKEIDRAVEFRKNNPITVDEVETGWRGDGIVRAMIWDNQLYIIEARAVTDHNHRPRALATMHSIHRAVSAYPGRLPNVEFTFTTHDSAELAPSEQPSQHTTWSYSRPANHEKLWLMPDFGFWGWPDVGLRSYTELQSWLEHQEDEFEDKIPKIIWRGSVHVGSHDVRAGLLAASEGKEWSDVRSIDWGNETDIEVKLMGMEEHCMYMFTVQTEGNTYSGRLKYLLNCASVLVSHPLRFIEHYHHLLDASPSSPNQNYVQVKRDFSDLPQKMHHYLSQKHFEGAKRIADNARVVFRERYLSPAAEACYWRALIRGWASVQGFKTDFWVDGEAGKRKMPRGTPFESYAIMEAVHWNLPAKARKIVEYD